MGKTQLITHSCPKVDVRARAGPDGAEFELRSSGNGPSVIIRFASSEDLERFAARLIQAVKGIASTKTAPATGDSLAGFPENMIVPEVAEVLRCSEELVYRLIREGELPAFHLGTKPLTCKEDLRAYIAGKRKRPGR